MVYLVGVQKLVSKREIMLCVLGCAVLPHLLHIIIIMSDFANGATFLMPLKGGMLEA